MEPVISPDLVQQLASGQRCELNCCSLHPDLELGMIWGVDPYGLDFIASNHFSLGDLENAKKALLRAHEVGEGDNLHDHYYGVD